jgi:hypothetical protein
LFAASVYNAQYVCSNAVGHTRSGEISHGSLEVGLVWILFPQPVIERVVLERVERFALFDLLYDVICTKAYIT